MIRQEELDQLVSDFEANYWAFVYRGGLKSAFAVDEDYERNYRLMVHCIHSLPRQRCQYCRIQRTAYGTNT